ncbi:MAG: dTDP-4-dehydrorhamnose reductase [Acidobacteriota bacterium]
MKIAVTGASGMLGQALCRTFRDGFEVVPWRSRDMDITSFEDVRSKIARLRPDWIVNAAAYTDVDRAESEAVQACRVNALGSRHLAMAASETGCRLLTFSTDYVFDGESKRPYLESDPVCPINEYGRSKWMGEDYIRNLCRRHLIVRTSWLFGPGGRDFVDTMLLLAASAQQVKVVEDQVGSPTFSRDLAAKTRELVEQDRRGTYHAANSGQCSKYEFACRTFEMSNLKVTVRPVPSSRFPGPAPRPRYSALACQRLIQDGISPLRPWQQALAEYLESKQ